MFSFTKEELKPAIDKAFLEIQPKIDIKGFRKGKVPMGVIQKMYGKQIEFDAVQDFTNDLFNKHIQDEKINMVGQGDLIDIKPVDDSFEVKIAYEIVADFELKDFKGITIEEPVHISTDEEVDEELNGILNYFSTPEDVDQVTDENHLVSVEVQPLDEQSGLPMIGKSEKSQIFVGDKNLMPELKAMLLNTKTQDSFTFAPPQAPNQKVNVTIMDIKKLVPPEFNNEWVVNMTKERLQTTEEYREDIAIRIQEQWNGKSRDEMENQIIAKLVEMNEFDVPPALVSSVSESMAEDFKKRYKDMDASFITADLYTDVAERTVRWELIRNKIIESEKIEIEDHDLEELVEKEIERTKGEHDATLAKIKSNRNLLESVLTKKVLDLVLDFAITEEIPFEEYSAKMQHGHDHDHDHEGHDHDHSDHDHHHHDHDHSDPNHKH
jgi:trigger factor